MFNKGIKYFFIITGFYYLCTAIKSIQKYEDTNTQWPELKFAG